MRRTASALIFLVFTLALAASPEAAWWSRDNSLVKIDGVGYTPDDFKRWWGFWKDKDTPLPETVEPYVEWLLLAREAEQMQLGEDPSLRRQLRVFLQSRALLLLKSEAVDSTIKITDADVRSHYEEYYTPRWLIRRVNFADEGAAAAARKVLVEGAATMEALLAKGAAEGGPVSQSEQWVRPSIIDPGWVEIFRKLKVGEVANPADQGEGKSLFELREQKADDDEDFAKWKEDARRDLWKRREGAKTRELLAELYKKYEVTVDQARIDALDLNAAEASLTADVVIGTSREKVTEKEFMAVIRRLIASRPTAAHATQDPELARQVKAEAVNNIIAVKLTDWEALDRHFEKREPFKWEYEFSRSHRMIGILEARLFGPNTAATEVEIRDYYQKNLERYTQPEMVKVYMIDDTQGPVDKVWHDVAVGGTFRKAAKDHLGRDVSVQEVPFNHLDPAVAEVVKKLTKGETSQPFPAQGKNFVVNLVERTAAEPLPLERVTKPIREAVEREKLRRERKAYLDLLKSRSKIERKDDKWQALRKELGGVK